MTIKQWAKQFTAITASDIEKFNKTVNSNLSLHDKKRLFTEQYQDKIAFSYILQVEKQIVKDLHIEKEESRDKYGYEDVNGYGYGDEYGYGSGDGSRSGYRDGSGEGDEYKYGSGSGDEYGYEYEYGYGDEYEDGSGCGDPEEE